MSGQFDETVDFVVVGNGGGSMCAGLFMRAQGKSVVILEKTDLAGGTTARSGGVMWVPNNRFMKDDGIEDSYEKAITYLDNTAGLSEDAPGATPERRAAYVSEAPRMVDFLHDQGIALRHVPYYPDYYDDRPGGSAPGSAYWSTPVGSPRIKQCVTSMRLRPRQDGPASRLATPVR